MKKFVLLAAAAAMGTMAVDATTVLAAQTNGGVYSTNGSIEFKPTEKVTKPVDPLDPTKTATPIDAEDPEERLFNQGHKAHCRLILLPASILASKKSLLKPRLTLQQHKNIKMLQVRKKWDPTLFRSPIIAAPKPVGN